MEVKDSIMNTATSHGFGYFRYHSF